MTYYYIKSSKGVIGLKLYTNIDDAERVSAKEFDRYLKRLDFCEDIALSTEQTIEDVYNQYKFGKDIPYDYGYLATLSVEL